MCGLSGFCNFNRDFTCNKSAIGESTNILNQMRKTIVYRGADESGEYLRKNVGLSHNRLSIRDISNGKQPMVRSYDGKEFVIVFNGEIYNTTELTAQLSERLTIKSQALKDKNIEFF